MTDDRIYAQAARAWPFEEAKKLVERYKSAPPKKGYVLFETGYGPSGLPHIGTFGEVVRTTMVRQAFQRLSDIPTRLFAFSDDMDGLRKVPTNVPNQEMLAQHLGKRLTLVLSTGGAASAYSEAGHHGHPFETFLLPYQQIARFTGLEWQPPWVFHDAHRASDAALAAHALALRQHLQQER